MNGGYAFEPERLSRNGALADRITDKPRAGRVAGFPNDLYTDLRTGRRAHRELVFAHPLLKHAPLLINGVSRKGRKSPSKIVQLPLSGRSNEHNAHAVRARHAEQQQQTKD